MLLWVSVAQEEAQGQLPALGQAAGFSVFLSGAELAEPALLYPSAYQPPPLSWKELWEISL